MVSRCKGSVVAQRIECSKYVIICGCTRSVMKTSTQASGSGSVHASHWKTHTLCSECSAPLQRPPLRRVWANDCSLPCSSLGSFLGCSAAFSVSCSVACSAAFSVRACDVEEGSFNSADFADASPASGFSTLQYTAQ